MARTDPRTGEEHSELIRSRIDLRDGVLVWKASGIAWWDTRYAGTPVYLQPAPCGYLRVKLARKKYLVHRVIWFLHYGYWPSIVDHINRDRTDNRLENLREVTHSQNQWNSGPRINNPSGHPGVAWCKRSSRWVAVVKAHGRRRYLGSFRNLEDAIRTRKQAEREREMFSFSGETA